VGKEKGLGRGGEKVRGKGKKKGEKEREGRVKEGGDRPQVVGSMSTLDRSFVGRCGGSVQCMCGP